MDERSGSGPVVGTLCRAPGPLAVVMEADMDVRSAVSAESAAFGAALAVVRAVEPRIAAAIGAELADQRTSLKLIASENYASPAVLLAMGNWLSDKYAEGTNGRRLCAC